MLFKYFDNRVRAERFLKGSFRCWSLSYYRDYEEQETRGDQYEGTALWKQPEDGLLIHNLTQGNTVRLYADAESVVKADEIFVFCMSRKLADRQVREFKAVAYAEISDVRSFCQRVQQSLRSQVTTYAGRPGHKQIGHDVEYYNPAGGWGVRYALPDMIATSKLDRYAWQAEFRLVFSFTDALAFQNIQGRFVIGERPAIQRRTEYPYHDIDAGRLDDICQIRFL